MPNITEYNLPLGQSDLTPSSAGPNAIEKGAMETQRAARVTQETGAHLGQMVAEGYGKLGRFVAGAGKLADDYFTQKDIASAAEAHTKLSAQAAQDLPGIIANAADPVKAVQDYYQNTYQPAVDKINNGMITKRGRMWAAEHSESGAQAFMHTGIAEAMNVQGARAIDSFNKSIDNISDAARADPHGLDNYIKQVDSLIDGTKSALSAQQQVHIELQREKMREHVAVSAGHALAEQNPVQFQKDLEAGWGKGVINEQNRTLLGHYATYQIHQQKLKAASRSSGIVVDWAAGGGGSVGPDGQPVAPTWNPMGIGWLANNPNVSPQDKKDAIELGAVGNQVMLWRRQFPATGRRASPHGNLGDEFELEQKINRGEAQIGDITGQMKRYLQSKGQFGINEQTASRLMAKLHPDKVEKYSQVHNDPVLKSQRERAEEYILAQSARIAKGFGPPGGYDDKGQPNQTVNGDFSGVANNPAYKQKIRDFRTFVDHTLEGAVDRRENWKEYMDPQSPKYLFKPENIQRFLPSTPELQSGVTFPEYKGQAFPNPAAPGSIPKKPLDEIFKGLGGPPKMIRGQKQE